MSIVKSIAFVSVLVYKETQVCTEASTLMENPMWFNQVSLGSFRLGYLATPSVNWCYLVPLSLPFPWGGPV